MKKGILLLTIFCFGFILTKAQWINQNAGFTNKTLGFYEMSIVDQNTVWAICYDGVGGLFGSAHILDFTRTTDGGATWTPGLMGSDSSLAFSSICALSDTEAWVAMHKFDLSTGGGLFHTTDGGITWNQSTGAFDANSFPNFVFFKDQLNGVAGGDASGGYFEIYTTIDGGNTWTRTPQANIPSFISGGGYGWFDGFAVLGDTVWFGTSAGEMYKSVDFGLTWSVSTVSPQGYTVYEIAFNDDGINGLTHVRSNTATYLFSTADGGATWSQLPSHPKWKQSKLTSVPGTHTFVSTSVINSNRGSAYSNDYGITWTQIDALTPKAACRFLNSTTGWAGGFFNDVSGFPLSGGIYKWDNSFTVDVNEIAMTEDKLTFIYPNPAKDKIIIPIPNGEYKVQFYNTACMLVKEIDIITAKPVDIADLPNGLYLIKSINNPGFAMKFIKQD